MFRLGKNWKKKKKKGYKEGEEKRKIVVEAPTFPSHFHFRHIYSEKMMDKIINIFTLLFINFFLKENRKKDI